MAASILVIGAAAAGTVLAGGTAGADPGPRSGNAASPHAGTGRGVIGNNTDGGGWHHIDPRGYHHTNPNVLNRLEQQDNRREYRSGRYNQNTPERALGTESRAKTWTGVQKPDGSGWAVCRPHASWC
ncbi:hypothetical protein [Nocardia sp. BMG51109]|uniref:hypothetical protein n=1 Tax=Nocardia sp. BMG51109 TaxID=1056816 RepID=UPI0004660B1C|nr:hypothetical protein [Nocardia sp. BMG51109]